MERERGWERERERLFLILTIYQIFIFIYCKNLFSLLIAIEFVTH